MRQILFALGLAAGAFAPAHAQAPDFSKIEVKLTDLGHNIYMMEGGGGNVVAAAGSDGVILIDSQAMAMAPKLKAALATKSKAPIKFLVNTHHHGDHVAGDPFFANEGAIVVGQENERKRLLLPQKNSATGEIDPNPVPANEIPTLTYASKMTLRVNGQTAELSYPGKPAHTDGDLIVHFRHADVIAAGDAFLTTTFPVIDVANGGSTQGFIDGLNRILDLAVPKHLEEGGTYIIPGQIGRAHV